MITGNYVLNSSPDSVVLFLCMLLFGGRTPLSAHKFIVITCGML